jgi:exopolysaccharide biosynthesis polyprenyl glycosylphosphotransferase
VPGPAANTLRETTLPVVLLAGDAAVSFGGLALGYWLRYDSMLGVFGLAVPGARFGAYLPLLLLGVVFLVAAFAQLGLYDGRMLLRKQQNLNLLFRGTAYWLVAYLAFSLVIKFDPPISRLFVVLAAFATLFSLWLWRELFYFALTRPALLPRLQRRVAMLGWNEDARALTAEINAHAAHPYTVVGHIAVAATGTASGLSSLGTVEELPAIFERQLIDVLIAADLELPRVDLQRITEQCERAYVEWKVMPTAFQIFLSGLSLQTVGSIPVLGVEDLAITRLLNRAAKRLLDLAGALIGLVVSAPFIAILGALIKLESPGGPVFFRQIRVGTGHRSFALWKLRSMRPDAAATDTDNQSTQIGDPRMLRIGAFLRRWNLDELPQYWNVLCGDMSLVGPRPERPHHVDQLADLIPHYLPRHLVKPGMTGWAQVNGLRGATDLDKRVRYDIYYIENWSLWFDCQIIFLTFFRWKSQG